MTVCNACNILSLLKGPQQSLCRYKRPSSAVTDISVTRSISASCCCCFNIEETRCTQMQSAASQSFDLKALQLLSSGRTKIPEYVKEGFILQPASNQIEFLKSNEGITFATAAMVIIK